MIFQKLFPNYKTKKQLKEENERLRVDHRKMQIRLNDFYGIHRPKFCSDPISYSNIIPIRVSARLPHPLENEVFIDELQFRLGKEIFQYCELKRTALKDCPDQIQITATIKIVDEGVRRYNEKEL